ncbi:MAG: aminomethyl-transferring glycine dehydrogenase subunit GcvPB [Anaerolineales bacterium]|jgi:glycine dehydrogenase subunit 2
MSDDIRQARQTEGRPNLRRFHQARWDEPVIFELSTPGARGILPAPVEEGIADAAGDVLATIPDALRRRVPPRLPEMSQVHVLRHYMRLSQEVLGADLNIDVGQGTCTMKYNPKVNDQLSRLPGLSELHPLQDESTIQGILEIYYQLEQFLKEISGLDRFTFQPGAGSQAIFTCTLMIRAYHASHGESDQRDEVITTLLSHPSDAACARTAGYKVITLYPESSGLPAMDALKAAVSERTAALLITNPEDTGIFNPGISQFVKIVHDAGGLCFYDQANANGLLGITRAREAGFDLCHFNLHKTFSAPHGCGGPGTGAAGCTSALERFLPAPTVERRGDHYTLDYDRPDSIGKVRSFHGVASAVLKAYAWVMSLGADGLREVAETAVLNNNYLLKKVLDISGVSAPYAEGARRIEQVRYSWEKLCEETGMSSEDLGLRAADFGVHYWTSHHPFIVPEPMTLEPTESYSQDDLDEYATILAHVAEEARSQPEVLKNAPHNSPVHRVSDERYLDDPELWAITWRAYLRKHGGEA